MIEFDEWMEKKCSVIQSTYGEEYAAAQEAWDFQQAKIDLLEKELTETQAFLNNQNHIKQTKIDELKKKLDCCREENKAHLEKIDSALNTLCKQQYSSGERIYNDVGNILKGNKDEN